MAKRATVSFRSAHKLHVIAAGDLLADDDPAVKAAPDYFEDVEEAVARPAFRTSAEVRAAAAEAKEKPDAKPKKKAARRKKSD